MRQAGRSLCGLSSASALHRLRLGGPTTPKMLSVVLSLILGTIGTVLWLEGGPQPRTWEAWFLLVVILMVAAAPMLLCWLFC